jgi:hypothetical protein
LIGTAGVVPEQSLANHTTFSIQCDEPVLLTTNTECLYPSKAAGLLDSSLQGSPPELWVYLGTVRVAGFRLSCDF